jgi:hypothetical protein
MFGRIKELFSYFAEAFRTFFGKFVLSILACLVYYAAGLFGTTTHDVGLSYITSDMSEFLEHNVSIVDAFNYNPVSTIILGIILIVTWFVANAIFETFAYHAITNKGKSVNFGAFSKLLKARLLKLIKTNILRIVYILLGFLPYIVCVVLTVVFEAQGLSRFIPLLQTGSILLIIPGIVMIMRYCASSYFVLSKDLNPHEALKGSKNLTYNYKLPLCILMFVFYSFVAIFALSFVSFGQLGLETAIMFSTFAIRPVTVTLGYYTIFVFSMRRDGKA